jgi:hypothetical protein
MGQFYASFDLLVSNGSDLLTKGVEGILQLGTDGCAIPSGMRSQVVQRFAYYLMSSGSSGLQCFQEQILNAFQVPAHTNKFVIPKPTSMPLLTAPVRRPDRRPHPEWA